MNILVIGGSSFIGWRLVNVLSSSGHSVTVINRGNHRRTYPSNVVHKVADRHDESHLAAALGNLRFDVAFDMCGFTEGDMPPVMRSLDGRVGKYVFISTAATYVEPLVMPIPEEFTQGVHGIWGQYGAGKLACERALLSAFEQTRFPSVVVRPSYVYGIGNSINRETFLFDRISKGRTILVPSDGEAVIQLGEVGDLCQALLLLAEKPGGSGECYNVSGAELITLKALVRLVASIMGSEYEIMTVEPKRYGFTDRELFPFDNSSYFTSSRKFSEEFGWYPKVSLRDGLEAAYVAWRNSSDRLPTSYDKEDSVLTSISNGDG
jgi:nucleoside-diphosphate-sugar epimerase